MALRTFRHNPSLGGFGEEGLSSLLLPDDEENAAAVGANAFCQIVKEIVDNAVDACRATQKHNKDNTTHCSSLSRNQTVNASTTSSRIRVNLDPVTEEDGTQVMRVTVTDNGRGMEDIQTCVDAFQTSKGHNAQNRENNNKQNDSQQQQRQDPKTSGRYGIGLTLCLLHAQRLVPNTRASIKSATSTQPNWTVMSCVVDTDADSVRCFPEDSIPKTTPEQSGTCVSLLVPGGSTAVLAWPRLAEYFARFQLSLRLNCQMEILAPSLSSVPLHVRPIQVASRSPLRTAPTKYPKGTPDKVTAWNDPLADDSDAGDEEEEEINVVTPHGIAKKSRKTKGNEGLSMECLLYAAQQFLESPVPMENLSHVTVPIRLKGIKASDSPNLEVSLVVHGLPDNEDDVVVGDNSKTVQGQCSTAEASMVLVRMVNQIPLLDSAEGVACGLVQGIVAKESLWQSVGLEVGLRPTASSMTRVPTFSVKDSNQVLPFLKSQYGDLLDEGSEEDDASSNSQMTDDDSMGEAVLQGRKRSRRHRPSRLPRKVFLPADARLGNILLIVQIHAIPSQLPLPTLCKGRIPQEHPGISQALEVGLKTCLRKLQTSNPALFLTARELRVVERKVCFVPLLSNALASILSRSQSEATREAVETVEGWREEDEDSTNDQSNSSPSHQAMIDRLSSLFRVRLHAAIEKPKKVIRRSRGTKQDQDDKSHHSDETGDEGLLLDSAMVDWVRNNAADLSSSGDESSHVAYNEMT